MWKYISSLALGKPVHKDETCVQFLLKQDALLRLEWSNPPYQSDLNLEKVSEMIQSYHERPYFGRFKNTLVFAVRMGIQKQLYLVDGQHRMEMLKQVNISYPFNVLFYPIQTDDQMRQLFREMNYDSHKNLAYVSLGADSARLADELCMHYENKPFTKSKKEGSRIYTIRAFVNTISKYLQQFHALDDLIRNLEEAQDTFMHELDFTHCYSEEKSCIDSKFIMPLKSCNFVEYLENREIEPNYLGKGKTISKTIPLSLKKAVWNKHIGMSIGEIPCPVCKTTKIHQMSFHCGHIIAKSNGGTNTIDNLRPICQSCNSSMGSTNMDDFIAFHFLT